MLIFGSIASSLQKAYRSIVEPFTRSDSASLGKAPGGQEWVSVRGSWGINSNKARGVAADKSISTLTFSSTDIAVSVDGIGPGCGTAFWVTDSGNWWGAYLDSSRSCQQCSGGGNCASYSSYTYCSSSYYAPAYYYYYVYYQENGPGNTAPCSNCGIYTYCGTNCKRVSIKEYAPSVYNCDSTATGYSCSSYNPSYTYECNCVTDNSVKIVQSVSGTISTVASKVLSGTIVGIKTLLSGNSITVKGYTGSGYTSESSSGELSYSASSPAKTKKHGIFLTVPGYNQTTDIDEFKAE